VSDERDRILKLLEDGKINADQAARLIEAVGSDRRESEFDGPVHLRTGARHLRMRGHLLRDLDRIPDVVASAVASAMKSGFEPGERRTEEFAGKRHLLVKSVSGDLEVAKGEAGLVRLSYTGGMVKVRSSGDQVVVRSMTGDVSASVPTDGRLEIEVVSGDVSVSEAGAPIQVKTVSGDVDIEEAAADARVETVSGDVKLDRVTGDLRIATRSGDVELVAAGPVSGSVTTVSGDVSIALPLPIDLMLELTSEEGGDLEIDSALQPEVLEEQQGYLKAKLGAGASTLKVKTRSADIEVRKAEGHGA